MLNEQLQRQIEQEAASDASSYGYATGTEVDEDLQSVYRYAAGKYAEKWQAAEQRADRYEKALNLISQMSDPGDYWVAICKMKSIAADALTPKTVSDE